MESAVLGVILDSSVAIEAEREHLDVAQFLRRIAETTGEREAALCSISVAELAHGIYRANTPERRERRRTFLYELKAAELVGRIGACALERGYAVTTRNPRHPFGQIPGLNILPL